MVSSLCDVSTRHDWTQQQGGRTGATDDRRRRYTFTHFSLSLALTQTISPASNRHGSPASLDRHDWDERMKHPRSVSQHGMGWLAGCPKRVCPAEKPICRRRERSLSPRWAGESGDAQFLLVVDKCRREERRRGLFCRPWQTHGNAIPYGLGHAVPDAGPVAMPSSHPRSWHGLEADRIVANALAPLLPLMGTHSPIASPLQGSAQRPPSGR